MAESLTIQIREELEEYVEKLGDEAMVIMQQVAKEALQQLKTKSPKLTGGYAKGWKVKTEALNKTVIIHNAKKPSLTHLLEYGHLSRNQFGAWIPETPAHPHIRPVEQWANAEVEKRIIERLNNV